MNLAFIIMQSEDIILAPIPTESRPNANSIKRSSPIKLFSLFVLLTYFIGIYRWYEHYTITIGERSLAELSKYDLLDVIQYDNGSSMEEIALKYRVYKFPLIGYSQPNIIIALCILLTFPTVILFIERETATPIAFFEFNLCSIYLQIVRVLIDLAHYFIASKCICLISGTGAIWLHLLTKITYYNAHRLIKSPIQIVTILITYLAAFVMIIEKDRLDLLLGITLAILDILFLEGGTIKYPKQVFQEKQEWAEAVKISRSPLWQDFKWNEYKVNELLCVDSVQFYVTREDRLLLVSKD